MGTATSLRRRPPCSWRTYATNADQSGGNRRHCPVQPRANRLLTASGFDAREASRRRGRLVEFGQGQRWAVEAGGLRGAQLRSRARYY